MHIAPNPIAVKAASGATLVGMNSCRWTASGASQDISQMTLSLEGTVDWADIGLVRVYYKNGSLFTPAAPGTQIDNGGAGYYFTSNTLVVNMDISTFTIDASSNQYVTVVFDFDAGQDTSATAAVEITALVNGPNGTGTGGTHAALLTRSAPRAPSTTTRPRSPGTDISPTEAEQTQQDVPVLRVFIDPLETTVTMDSIKVHAVGSPRDDNDVGSVKLYLDDGDGTSSPRGSRAGRRPDRHDDRRWWLCHAHPPIADETITTTGKTYFVAVDVGSVINANAGHVIGFEVEDPRTDIVFVDIVADSYTNQKGYITQATPTANGSSPLSRSCRSSCPSGRPPTGPSTSRGRTTSPRSSPKRSTNHADLRNLGHHPPQGLPSAPRTGLLTYSAATLTATINPTANLAWGETYTATVTIGVLNDVGDYRSSTRSSGASRSSPRCTPT